ncbi:hypothetical protein [Streptomyces sp. SS52]|uniref:hypothetical protein n=1 Tax=Streptomyces sp. SS52 TaxID=2563602 RepID=UPI0032B5D5BC
MSRGTRPTGPCAPRRDGRLLRRRRPGLRHARPAGRLAAGKSFAEAAVAATEAWVEVVQAAIRQAIQDAIDNSKVPIDGETGLPDGAESCLTPFGDPIEHRNNTNPWELGWSWLTGSGPRSQCFGPDDEFTGIYREHTHTKGVLEYFLREWQRTGKYELGRTYMYDYALSGPEGVGKYLTDYGTLATAGLTGNLAYTFLGSHQVRMTPIRENADGSVTWRYTAYNESDIESATHPPVIGYTDLWSDTVGAFVDKVIGDEGPMSPKTQVIEFNVTLGP